MAKQENAAKSAKKTATKEVAKEVVVQDNVRNNVQHAEQPKQDTWEIKDRHYFLKNNFSPLTYTMPGKHTVRSPLLWFDEKTGEQKEIRYATNQNSPFKSEQSGEVTLEHIVFTGGTLFVPKHKQNLQKLLSLYHPSLNKVYLEYDSVQEATDEIDDLELELEAMIAAKAVEVDHAEAILRVENGSEVSKMSSKELKRDLLLLAKSNPKLFLELANDENVQLRNFGVKAMEAGLIALSGDQREFRWPNTDRKIMTVPFDENPYTALAAFFKTDEGMDVYRSLEKKLN